MRDELFVGFGFFFSTIGQLLRKLKNDKRVQGC